MSATPPPNPLPNPLRYILTHRPLRETLALALVGGGGAAGAALWSAGRAISPELAWLEAGILAGLVLALLVVRHAPADAQACAFMWPAGVLGGLAGWLESPALVALAAASATICWAGLVRMLGRTLPRRRRVLSSGLLIAAGVGLLIAMTSVAAPWTWPPASICWYGWVYALYAVGAAGVATVVRYRRAPVRPGRWFAFAWVQFLASFWHGMRRAGRPRLPIDGPAVVAVTHVSTVDPLLMQASCGRLLQWMIAREYYDLWWLGWAYRLAGCIPVRRGQRDVGAPREALRVLEAGGVVGIFPAGGIQLPDAPPRPLHLGAAQLALRAGVPLIPVRIRNMQHRGMAADLLRPHRGVVVEWGEPIGLDDLSPRPREREALIEATGRLAAFLGGQPVGAQRSSPLDRQG